VQPRAQWRHRSDCKARIGVETGCDGRDTRFRKNATVAEASPQKGLKTARRMLWDRGEFLT
jgi:hypothetical protein